LSVDSVTSGLGSSFLPILQKLLGSGELVHKGAILYHKSSEIEYTYQISIGNPQSRINEITKRLKQYLTKPVEFDDVIEIYGFGLPHNEDLKKIGIIKVEGQKATIDFSAIFKTIKSELVTITIRKPFPEILRRKIVEPHMVKSAKHSETDYTETNLEIALDYSDLWYKHFDKFTIREIEFTFNLRVALDSIEQTIPKDFSQKFIHAAKMAKRGDNNALQFIKIAQDKFMLFQNQEKTNEMFKTISINPEQNFKITHVNPVMQSCEIGGAGHPIVLPGSMNISLEGRIEKQDVALSGTLRIDLKQFNRILRNIIDEIKIATKKINF